MISALDHIKISVYFFIKLQYLIYLKLLTFLKSFKAMEVINVNKR